MTAKAGHNSYQWLQAKNKGKGIEQLIITSQNGFKLIKVDQVISIRSIPGNYVIFSLHSEQELLCTKPLNHYEKLLEGNFFFRIHRSHIVNLEHVTGYNSNKGKVIMSNGDKLPVAIRRKKDFMQIIHTYFEK